MDILINKSYESYNYTNRYGTIPYYHNTIDQRDIYGIGSNVDKDATYVLHKVEPNDDLDYLALKYYNNPTYWWVIAYFNDIQDSFCHLIESYTTLKIPSISGISFGADR